MSIVWCFIRARNSNEKEIIVKKYFILFALILIQGCSSGGGDSTPATTLPTTNADPTGVWEGTVTENGVGTFDLTGIVVGNQLRFISDTAGVIYVGTISVSGTSFTATTTSYAIGGTVFATSNLTGTVGTKSTISGTFSSSTGSTGSFSLTYDTVTDKGSSLAITDGNWTETSGGSTTTVSIDSTGLLTGSDTDGCVYLGSVSIIDSSSNIYNLSFSASSCGLFNGTYAGYAVISDTVTTNDTFNFVVNNSNYIIINNLTRT